MTPYLPPTRSPTRTIITSFTSPSPAAATTNDSNDYILRIAAPPSSLTGGVGSGTSSHYLTCASSNRSILTYDAMTLQIHNTLRDVVPPSGEHRITDLATSCHRHGNADGTKIVVATGTDGLVKLYDLRTSSHASRCFSLPKKETPLSIALGYDGTLAAVGTHKARIHFYDLRHISSSSGSSTTPTPLGSYNDAHTDDITRLRFHPTNPSLLLSASEDGLVCLFDTSRPSEEDALRSVMNVECPVRDAGFFGGEGVYCLTGSETLSCWHGESAMRVCDFGGEGLR
eukprot:CAMPEP_0172507840 /NCGR_PEP_ID=MMETSP1066-20121228/206978_1 /TAXON_ID=671091 /ORGANISM="Coscinodiscus wailesii, Strain CCMP2513" /LENGTH=284 /DNA_ID=CAMNT_0013285543 /DNA_START=63 /DNA_END=914 /DNA_ORIENTATION=-